MDARWTALLLLACLAVPATAADLELHATLDGANVVSATESTGSGEAHAWLGEDDRVRIEFVFGGLEAGATGAGLYQGAASENGDLVAEFAIVPDATSGRLNDIAVALSADVAASMRAGGTYVQVATPRYPDGAIRGQLVPQPVRLEGPEPEED